MNANLNDWQGALDKMAKNTGDEAADADVPAVGEVAENPDISTEIEAEQVMPSNDELPGACRVQSPSSIITFNQCPRKYYYRYIEKLPGGKSIHLIRGSVVHKVLEDIYDLDVSKLPDQRFSYTLSVILQEAFRKEWIAASNKLAELDMSPEDLEFYFEDSKQMIENFFHYLYDNMRPHLKEMSEKEAFRLVAPEREILMQSPQQLVRGYIDAIHTERIGSEEKTIILDYKTSKRLHITPEYRLQLGIYAMMHEEKHHTPDEVGILFLKHGRELRLPVTPELIQDARKTCHDVQLLTKSTALNDYPKNPTPLCKWKTGQCEYYELCFMNWTPDQYREKMKLKR